MANVLSLLRIIMAPIFAFLVLNSYQVGAVIVLSLASLTDLFDGYVARNFGKVTEIGKILDPVADRILIIISVVSIFIRYQSIIPLWLLLVIIIRELFISLGFLYVYKKKSIKIEVTWLGKTATAFIFIALVLILLMAKIGILVLYVGVMLYIVAGIDYFLKAINT